MRWDGQLNHNNWRSLFVCSLLLLCWYVIHFSTTLQHRATKKCRVGPRCTYLHRNGSSMSSLWLGTQKINNHFYKLWVGHGGPTLCFFRMLQTILAFQDMMIAKSKNIPSYLLEPLPLVACAGRYSTVLFSHYYCRGTCGFLSPQGTHYIIRIITCS